MQKPPQIGHSKHAGVGELVQYYFALQKQPLTLYLEKLFVGQGVSQMASHNYNYFTF